VFVDEPSNGSRPNQQKPPKMIESPATLIAGGTSVVGPH